MTYLNAPQRLIALALLLSACTPQPMLNTPHVQQQMAALAYWFRPLDFGIHSADNAAQLAIVTAAKTRLEADIKANNLAEYRRSRDFSIQLLAGSEGNHLLAGSEGNHFRNSDKLLPDLKLPAQALIFNPNGNHQLFKGEYEQEKFFFAGQEEIALPNTTYLLLPDTQGQVQIYQGELESPTRVEAPPPANEEVTPSTPSTQAMAAFPVYGYAAATRAAEYGSTLASGTVTGQRLEPPAMMYGYSSAPLGAVYPAAAGSAYSTAPAYGYTAARPAHSGTTSFATGTTTAATSPRYANVTPAMPAYPTSTGSMASYPALNASYGVPALSPVQTLSTPAMPIQGEPIPEASPTPAE